MKNEDQYIGTGREGNNVDDAPDTIVKDGIEFSKDSKTRTAEGVKHFALGSLAAFVSFIVACYALSFFDIHYVIKALAALFFSILVIKAYDKATGEMPTPKTGAVSNVTIILFVLCLFTGYQNDQGKSAGALFDKIFFAERNLTADVNETEEGEAFSSESGTVRLGEVWFPSKIFASGSKVKIKVEYNAVKMSDGRVLEPGFYEEETLSSDGQIIFEGIETNPSKVTITY